MMSLDPLLPQNQAFNELRKSSPDLMMSFEALIERQAPMDSAANASSIFSDSIPE